MESNKDGLFTKAQYLEMIREYLPELKKIPSNYGPDACIDVLKIEKELKEYDATHSSSKPDSQ